jgi:hypothetical protein
LLKRDALAEHFREQVTLGSGKRGANDWMRL